MRIAVAGGGPAGLFFAILIRRAVPSAEVTVFERNRADDTFGFGVVFSDRTLAGIHQADPVLTEALGEFGRHWDTIEVRLKGQRIRCGGNGMAAVARRTLLALLQSRARESGAELRFAVAAADPSVGERVCLYVVPHPGASVTLEQVRAGMEEAGVARFKFPEYLVIVSALPATKVGKIDKKALRDDITRRLAAQDGVQSVSRPARAST
jgi:salicyloyl-CoA 5-hydroxylase